MKKLLIFLSISLICIALLPTFAMATTTEQDIENLATTEQKVLRAKCIIFERNCLIAIQTEKFATKSEYKEYTEQLKNIIKEKYQIDNVGITRNPKLMKEMEMLQLLDEQQRSEQIQQIIERYLNHPMPLPYIKPPRC